MKSKLFFTRTKKKKKKKKLKIKNSIKIES